MTGLLVSIVLSGVVAAMVLAMQQYVAGLHDRIRRIEGLLADSEEKRHTFACDADIALRAMALENFGLEHGPLDPGVWVGGHFIPVDAAEPGDLEVGQQMPTEYEVVFGEHCDVCGHTSHEHRGEDADYFCRTYVGPYERCHCTARMGAVGTDG